MSSGAPDVSRAPRQRHFSVRALFFTLFRETLKMLSRLWSDECGAILSAELMLLVVILVIGLSVGAVALRDAVDAQLVQLGLAVSSIDSSFSYTGLDYSGTNDGSGVTASIAGSQWQASDSAAGVSVSDVLTAIPPGNP